MALTTDVLILGSGIAGLSFALKAAESSDVLIVTKNDADEANTRYAQGGIASVTAQADDFESHVQDTITAGAELGDADVVRRVVEAGPRLINELLESGVRFSKRSEREFDLAIEGGHSKRRVLHAGDITGREIEDKLLARAKAHPRIKILEHHLAVDLITDRHLTKSIGEARCYGAYVLRKATREILTIRANTTLLATGGAGKTYLYTTNPDVATGDGIAMAYRAGCRVANLEFVQFHPTCLYHPQAKSFLISEALRGEGGTLRLIDGTAFMSRYDSRAELAPRDIVARAIDYELKKSGDPHVLLDMTHLPRSFLRKRFPNIDRTCRKYGYDMSEVPLPVVPAAHYFCGGVVVDRDARTDLTGLYAIGEVSCTGLHGANRLASNSLLEGLAYADFAANDLKNHPGKSVANVSIRDWDFGHATDSDEAVVIAQNWDEIRRMMWNYVGIVRSDKRLIRAERRIKLLGDEIKEYYWNFRLEPNLVELRNIWLVAALTIAGAARRQESVGLHHNIDHPQIANKPMAMNIIKPGELVF